MTTNNFKTLLIAAVNATHIHSSNKSGINVIEEAEKDVANLLRAYQLIKSVRDDEYYSVLGNQWDPDFEFDWSDTKKNGDTPVQLAARSERTKMMQLLITAGANTTQNDSTGQSVLAYVSSKKEKPSHKKAVSYDEGMSATTSTTEPTALSVLLKSQLKLRKIQKKNPENVSTNPDQKINEPKKPFNFYQLFDRAKRRADFETTNPKYKTDLAKLIESWELIKDVKQKTIPQGKELQGTDWISSQMPDKNQYPEMHEINQWRALVPKPPQPKVKKPAPATPKPNYSDLSSAIAAHFSHDNKDVKTDSKTVASARAASPSTSPDASPPTSPQPKQPAHMRAQSSSSAPGTPAATSVKPSLNHFLLAPPLPTLTPLPPSAASASTKTSSPKTITIPIPSAATPK